MKTETRAVHPPARPVGDAVPLLTAEMVSELLESNLIFWPEQRAALRAIASGAAVVVPARPVEGERERFECPRCGNTDQTKFTTMRGDKTPSFCDACDRCIRPCCVKQAALAQSQPASPPPDDAVTVNATEIRAVQQVAGLTHQLAVEVVLAVKRAAIKEKGK